MSELASKLIREGFQHVATMRRDDHAGYAMDFNSNAAQLRHIIYVATRDEAVIYVGKTVHSVTVRYGRHHMKWLRGEIGNSESPRLKWIAALADGPIDFFARCCDEDLHSMERRMIRELQPSINATSRARVTPTNDQRESTQAEPPTRYVDWEDYWREFISVCEQHLGADFPFKRGSYWVEFPTNTSRVLFAAKAKVRGQSAIAVEFFAEMRSPDEAANAFAKRSQHSSAIQEGLRMPSEWEHVAGSRRLRVVAQRFDVQPQDQTTWPEQHHWMASNVRRFKTVIGPIIERIF